MPDFEHWEPLFIAKLKENDLASDPAHDLHHFERVVKTAKKISLSEKANLNIVIPAAWLHDLINVPKNDPRRKIASRLSADAAIEFLTSIHYPEISFDG